MLAYAGYLSPLSAEERSSSFSKASADTLSRQRLVSEVVLRDALSCYAWYTPPPGQSPEKFVYVYVPFPFLKKSPSSDPGSIHGKEEVSLAKL